MILWNSMNFDQLGELYGVYIGDIYDITEFLKMIRIALDLDDTIFDFFRSISRSLSRRKKYDKF